MTTALTLLQKKPPIVEVYPTTNKATIQVPSGLNNPFIQVFVEKINGAKIAEMIKTEKLLRFQLTQGMFEHGFLFKFSVKKKQQKRDCIILYEQRHNQGKGGVCNLIE